MDRPILIHFGATRIGVVMYTFELIIRKLANITIRGSNANQLKLLMPSSEQQYCNLIFKLNWRIIVIVAPLITRWNCLTPFRLLGQIGFSGCFWPKTSVTNRQLIAKDNERNRNMFWQIDSIYFNDMQNSMLLYIKGHADSRKKIVDYTVLLVLVVDEKHW